MTKDSVGIDNSMTRSFALNVKLNDQVEYVGSEAIIRSGADMLSRDSFDDRSCLRPEVFRGLVAACRVEPTMEAFAEAGYGKFDTGGMTLPYYSRMPEVPPSANYLGYDGLVRPWRGVVYAYPPIFMAHSAVEKALREAEKGCVVM